MYGFIRMGILITNRVWTAYLWPLAGRGRTVYSAQLLMMRLWY